MKTRSTVLMRIGDIRFSAHGTHGAARTAPLLPLQWWKAGTEHAKPTKKNMTLNISY